MVTVSHCANTLNFGPDFYIEYETVTIAAG
jgi:hypothetical protein